MKRFSESLGGRKPMADINVTSLVDVTMVLLIIFILVAPILEQGLEVRLPAARPSKLPMPESVALFVDKAGKMELEGQPVDLPGLGERLGDIARANPDVFLVIRADEEVPYGPVVRALDEARAAGIVRLGMATRPATGR